MSRRIEVHPTTYGRVYLETWVNGRRTDMTEAISREVANERLEKMDDVEIIDHTQTEFGKPGKRGPVKFS